MKQVNLQLVTRCIAKLKVAAFAATDAVIPENLRLLRQSDCLKIAMHKAAIAQRFASALWADFVALAFKYSRVNELPYHFSGECDCAARYAYGDVVFHTGHAGQLLYAETKDKLGADQ